MCVWLAWAARTIYLALTWTCTNHHISHISPTPGISFSVYFCVVAHCLNAVHCSANLRNTSVAIVMSERSKNADKIAHQSPLMLFFRRFSIFISATTDFWILTLPHLKWHKRRRQTFNPVCAQGNCFLKRENWWVVAIFSTNLFYNSLVIQPPPSHIGPFPPPPSHVWSSSPSPMPPKTLAYT